MTRATWIHLLKFNAVGGMGIGVQLIALTGLRSGPHMEKLRSGARMQPTAPAVGGRARTDQPRRGDRNKILAELRLDGLNPCVRNNIGSGMLADV